MCGRTAGDADVRLVSSTPRNRTPSTRLLSRVHAVQRAVPGSASEQRRRVSERERVEHHATRLHTAAAPFPCDATLASFPPCRDYFTSAYYCQCALRDSEHVMRGAVRVSSTSTPSHPPTHAPTVNAGPFHGPTSGLTHLSSTPTTQLSAYRFHTADPLAFSAGIRMVFRNGDTTDPATGLKCTLETGGSTAGSPTAANMTTCACAAVHVRIDGARPSPFQNDRVKSHPPVCVRYMDLHVVTSRARIEGTLSATAARVRRTKRDAYTYTRFAH